MAWPVPVPDADSEPYWASLREHAVRVQRCDDCSTFRFPPREICDRCQGRLSTWVACSGRAHLVSWIVTHQAFGQAFRESVPYTVLLVRLDEQEDILLYGNLRDASPEELSIGMALDPVYEDGAGGVTLLHWRPRRPRSPGDLPVGDG
jgi:uncharacterized OB-fold protein